MRLQNSYTTKMEFLALKWKKLLYMPYSFQKYLMVSPLLNAEVLKDHDQESVGDTINLFTLLLFSERMKCYQLIA